MFKGEPGGQLYARLQEFLRSRGFPSWFTVTVAPKGSYREQDIIAWCKKHLEPWKKDRDWRIMPQGSSTAAAAFSDRAR